MHAVPRTFVVADNMYLDRRFTGAARLSRICDSHSLFLFPDCQANQDTGKLVHSITGIAGPLRQQDFLPLEVYCFPGWRVA